VPTPSHQDQVRAVFSERAATYTTSASHTDPEVLARVVELARPQAGWRVLDVATGTGHTAFALAPHARHVTGIDLTPEMLTEARGLQAGNGLGNVSFAVADAHRLPFADEAFDLVTARRAPHHFADLRGTLAEMRRVLRPERPVRPGGRLVIDDRSVPEDDEVDAIMNRLDTLHDPSHVREYRPSEWRAMLCEAGFRAESVEPYALLRPVSALKRDAPAADCAAIDRIMVELTERQRSLMGVTWRDGQLYHLHFYVMVAALRA
jgi:ubiquinone/menaquinone biosynthesis C-methylase UbiE